MMIKLDLTKPQIRKLIKAKQVQLKPEQIGRGMEMKFHPEMAKKLMKAHKSGRGVRLSMTPEEVDGAGLHEVIAKVKDVAKKIGKAYKSVKPVVAPYVKKGVESAIDLGTTALEGALLASEVGAPLIPVVQALKGSLKPKAVKFIGQKTGAYGLKKSGAKVPKRKLPVIDNDVMQDNADVLKKSDPMHTLDIIQNRVPKAQQYRDFSSTQAGQMRLNPIGSSFKVSGGSFKPSVF